MAEDSRSFVSMSVNCFTSEVGMSTQPSSFIIATDAFMRSLVSGAGPQGPVRTFADDIAMFLESIWNQVTHIQSLFISFG